MIKYNVTGAQRKRLVKKLSALTGIKPVYQGLPSMAFKVGNYIVTKTGTIEGDVPNDIIKALARSGFKGQVVDDPRDKNPDIAGITFKIPMDTMTDAAVDNFSLMLKTKGPLIKKAFKLTALPVDYGDDVMTVKWFEDKTLPAQTASYAETFINAMVDKAKGQKYVIDRSQKMDNPKYCFRTFLNTIGLSGADYKPLRKELLKNLNGCTRYRHPSADPYKKGVGQKAMS